MKTPPLDAWLVPRRRDRPELLDRGIGDAAAVSQSLRDLHRVNVLLGGSRSLTGHLYPRLAALGRPATVLDIGAGSGDIARCITRWGAQHSHPVTVIAADLTARHLAHAPAGGGVARLQANALEPPLAPNSVDYVISSLFLHHFSPPQLTIMLGALWRAARCGLVMTDLVRGRLPEIGWHLSRPVFARSWITYHDGLVSVQRAYRPEEMQVITAQAGIERAHVRTEFPWRMVITAEKPSV